MSSLKSLSLAIRQAGFDAFAIMPTQPLKRMLPILQEAQEKNRYPDFVDPDINKRINPQNLQKSAQSIIALAMSYYTEDPGPNLALHGMISRSAWGLDYHQVLSAKMEQIILYLQTHFGAKECTKAVDTTFLIDRALAIEAGLGYPGYNCSVYVPPFGSWVFLGEILVDVALPYTKKTNQDNWDCPVGCDACLQACPTNALFAPGKIKPQRCLSYLTQKSGSIPMEYRAKLGTTLWGCDLCQQACPRNQTALKSSNNDFAPLIGPHVPLIPLLAMNKQEFEDTFGKTSMAWRGKNTIQRNACIVLGNQGNLEAIEPLKEIAHKHPSPIVREAAQWALTKIESS